MSSSVSPAPAASAATRSPRLRRSVREIPTPGVDVERPPRYEPLFLKFWFVSAVAGCMIGLGIGIEIALHVSRANNGYYVPEKNVFSFASTQFLTSFFPTLLIVPLAYFWTISDWMLRWYQPYVSLAQGRVPASRSILLDYIALNPIFVLFYSIRYQHHLIWISSIIALMAVLLQPLSGSLLEVRQVPHTTNTVALGLQTVSLSPNINQLDAFLASAGYVDAAVYGDLGDPPYVHGVWTAARFEELPGSYLNGTLAVNVTGIRSNVNCIGTSSMNLTTSSSNYTVQASFNNSCIANLVFDPSDGNQQFSAVNVAGCAPQGENVVFQPVVFWYYFQDTSSNAPQVAAVFCNPTMDIFGTTTSKNLNDGSLGQCAIIDDFVQPNNVTGSPLNGRPYNGVTFNQSDTIFVAARAIAINSGVPGTIYRYASQQPGGLQAIFNNQNGWLNATTKIYTQHLAIAAQANYFGPANGTVPAILTADVPRLFVQALSAHILSVVMIVIGISALIVHFFHLQSRRKIWLTSPPGSIAAIVSLTSRSGFGELLLPYDDESKMHNKLGGLKFHLDERTGAIIADDDEDMDAGDRTALLKHEKVDKSASLE